MSRFDELNRASTSLDTDLDLAALASSAAFFSSSIDFFISVTFDVNDTTSIRSANPIDGSSTVAFSLEIDFGFFSSCVSRPRIPAEDGGSCRMAGLHEKSGVLLKRQDAPTKSSATRN
jgi:hypothetical protein